MKPRFVIDMDNTLYPSQFARVCYELYGKPDNPGVELLKWDWHRDYGLTDEQFYAAVNVVHASQLDYEPFPGAVEAITAWHEAGHHITIATHRKTTVGNFEALVGWLFVHHVPYDAIYMGLHGKEHLFGPSTIVIDDMPVLLRRAVELNCLLAVSLAHPYVKKTVDEFSPYTRMGETWAEVTEIINICLEAENLRGHGLA